MMLLGWGSDAFTEHKEKRKNNKTIKIKKNENQDHFEIFIFFLNIKDHTLFD